MTRIYNLDKGYIYTTEKGWITYQKYTDNLKRHNFLSIEDFSLYFVDERGRTGYEDFSLERFKNLEEYNSELRLFGTGRGRKRVAKNIKSCGIWLGKRKNIINYLKNKYKNELNLGYELILMKL